MTSSSSVSSPDKIIDRFPNSALPKITPEPHYESLVELRDMLKDNSSSIKSRRGGGTYSYPGGLHPDAVYAILAPGTSFVIPPDPDQLIITSGTNIVTSGNLHRDHTEATREFKKWINLERAGKKQIAEAVSKTFLAVVFYCNRGFAHLRVRNIVTHLFTEYGQVENQDLFRNRSKLSEPWNANRPSQGLVQRVQEIQEFANDGGRTISNKYIVDTIYTLVYSMGLFYDDCDKWDDKQRDEKYWSNFQAHFQAEQRKYKRKKKPSTRAGGYHGANNIKEMDRTHDALINLVMAAAEDRETMMSQCKTIADLTKTLATLTRQLQQATTGNNRRTGLPVDRQSQANSKWANGKHLQDVGKYCWTHGHCVDIGHDSKMG